MTNKSKGTGAAVAAFLAVVAVILAAVIGWCMNVYKLVSGMDEMTLVEAVVRGVGVVAAPLGALAGYF